MNSVIPKISQPIGEIGKERRESNLITTGIPQLTTMTKQTKKKVKPMTS